MEETSLTRLAASMGILPSYERIGGNRHHTSDDTYLALLGALGLSLERPEDAEAELARIRRRLQERIVPPTVVLSPGEARTVRVSPREDGLRLRRVEVELDSGERIRVDGAGADSATVDLGTDLPFGYHHQRLIFERNGRELDRDQHLIVIPPRCPAPAEVGARPRTWGLVVNLYTVRSHSNWGAGNLRDLERVLDWAGSQGASFVGINPMHAIRNSGEDVSPYRPVSRIFRNPLYLDVPSIPELADSEPARRLLAASEEEIAALRRTPEVPYDRWSELAPPILRALHQTFLRTQAAGGPRALAYQRYASQFQPSLQDHATFLALEAHFEEHPTWRQWPRAYQTPDSQEVLRFRQSHSQEIDFHAYVQFELDRQLERAQSEGRAAGLDLGVYQDLAIGSSPDGSDVWGFPGLFVDGASVGAPPDPFAEQGQDWGLPPLHPHRMAEDGYRYWRTLIRSSLRHAGALRIDHVMGLQRQFWVPSTLTGEDGAYVSFPASDLFGILALESHRAQAVVVGEDLGTVPPGFPDVLRHWGLLSSRVVYFQQEPGPRFLPAATYPARCLATINTHDLAPLHGWVRARDVELRERALPSASDEPEDSDAAAWRRAELQALLQRLREDGLLPNETNSPSNRELSLALHHFLASTPSALVGASLDDLARETEPVNLPGISQEGYPSWRRRMSRTIEELMEDPEVDEILRVLRTRNG